MYIYTMIYCYLHNSKKKGALFFLLLISTLLSVQTFSQADSITVIIKPSYDSVTRLHRFLLGENYRKLWAVPVTIRTFYLSKENGGFTVVKQGGGLQTRSLRLRDTAGKEWVLRTIEKYPERKLPPNLKASIVKDILVDQVTTANPFAALTVPPFETALGIPHANPQIVYVADDEALGEYRSAFANKVFLFEERDAESNANTDNSAKMQEKLKGDNDVSIDQEIVLRARLLDMLLGDWDRHEDQWRWEKIKNKKETIYIPVPRDRDQVYYKTSGVFPWIVSHQFLMSKFQGFNATIRDIEGWNVNARFFDRLFLTGLDEQQWKEQIAYVQNSITDSLINAAIQLLPPPVYALSGKEIIQKLIIRRKNLEKLALRYYRFISKTVDVPLSDKHEHVDVHYNDDGHVAVTIYKIKKSGGEGRILYQRVFVPGITKEIRLYGRGGNDIFSVTGNQTSSIKIRMIGGEGVDSFYVDANTPNKQDLYIYDRKDEKNIIPKDINAKKRMGRDSTVNAFEPDNFKYNLSGPVFSADYNKDDNIILKAGWLYMIHGFRKTPFASRQELWVNYSTGRNFFRIIYEGDFKKVAGNNDLSVNIYSRGPHYVRNFFGVGNETIFPDKGNRKINYYRARFDFVTAEARLRHPLAKYLSISAGIRSQYYSAAASENVNNSIDSFSNSNPGNNIFSNKLYVGLVAGIVYDSKNDATLPNAGIQAQLNMMAIKTFDAEKKSFTQVTAGFEHFLSLTTDSTIVLANRVGAGTTGGKPAFFQLLYLGGSTNLRGYRNYRFAGNSFVYHNIEIRVKLFDFTSYLLPGTVGLTLFNDLGRVWVPGESSTAWHDGYGAGIYIRPAQLALIQIQAGHSPEGWQPYITLGFRF